MKRAAVYVRISTNEQNPDLQNHELPEYCGRRGWQVAESTRIASAVARIAALGLIALWLMHVDGSSMSWLSGNLTASPDPPAIYCERLRNSLRWALTSYQ